MAITLSFYNSKGGVSKTISAANVGASLRLLGYKVLLIDLDPQANLSQHFGQEECDQNLYDVILEELDVKDIIRSIDESMHIIPGNVNLYPLDYQLHSFHNKEYILRNIKTERVCLAKTKIRAKVW